MERLQRLVRQIGGLSECRAWMPRPDSTLVRVWVRDGRDSATFDLDLTDLTLSDAALRVLLESRLDGIREWAHWTHEERMYLDGGG
jgi:hypothetical protein